MTAGYSLLVPDRGDAELSGKSETHKIDADRLVGCTAMRPKVWYLEPGNDRKNYHVHSRQEELYVVLSGPGRMTVGGETITVPEGGLVRVPPETPRKTFNDTDQEHVWLVVGAPNVDDPGRPVDEG